MWIAALSKTTAGLDPEIERLLGEIHLDWIVHCGDIGDSEILVRLSEFAPTIGVLGPKDDAGEHPFSTELSKTLGGCTIYVSHDIGRPARPSPTAALSIERVKPRLVLHAGGGQAISEVIDGVVWTSPGRSVAVIELKGGQVSCELISPGQSL